MQHKGTTFKVAQQLLLNMLYSEWKESIHTLKRHVEI